MKSLGWGLTRHCNFSPPETHSDEVPLVNQTIIFLRSKRLKSAGSQGPVEGKRKIEQGNTRIGAWTGQ
jgi:hypothetical protein